MNAYNHVMLVLLSPQRVISVAQFLDVIFAYNSQAFNSNFSTNLCQGTKVHPTLLNYQIDSFNNF